jgi:hypothetical protein
MNAKADVTYLPVAVVIISGALRCFSSFVPSCSVVSQNLFFSASAYFVLLSQPHFLLLGYLLLTRLVLALLLVARLLVVILLVARLLIVI